MLEPPIKLGRAPSPPAAAIPVILGIGASAGVLAEPELITFFTVIGSAGVVGTLFVATTDGAGFDTSAECARLGDTCTSSLLGVACGAAPALVALGWDIGVEVGVGTGVAVCGATAPVAGAVGATTEGVGLMDALAGALVPLDGPYFVHAA